MIAGLLKALKAQNIPVLQIPQQGQAVAETADELCVGGQILARKLENDRRGAAAVIGAIACPEHVFCQALADFIASGKRLPVQVFHGDLPMGCRTL